MTTSRKRKSVYHIQPNRPQKQTGSEHLGHVPRVLHRYNHLGTAYRSRGNNLPSQHTTHRTTIPTFSPNAYLSTFDGPSLTNRRRSCIPKPTPTISNRRKASGSRSYGHITPLSFLSCLLIFNNFRLGVYVLCMYVVLGTCSSYAPPPKRKCDPGATTPYAHLFPTLASPPEI